MDKIEKTNEEDDQDVDTGAELVKAIRSLERTIQQQCHLLNKAQSSVHLKKKDSSFKSVKEENISEKPCDRQAEFKGPKVKNFLCHECYLNIHHHADLCKLFL